MISGIKRAIKAVGTQQHLAFLMSEETGETIKQPRISEWLAKGYVPASRAGIVAKLTGVPLDDLTKKPNQRKRRRGK